VSAVADLHLKLLDWGPISRLGRQFLERFVYSHLVHHGLLKAALFEVEGQPVGFIAYTPYSMTFHRISVREHWKALIYNVMLSLLRNPLLIPRMVKASRLVFSRRAKKRRGEDPIGEILAIGVLPEFSSPEFLSRTGLRISRELFDLALTFFKSQGVRKMRLAVDEFNKPALIFYSSLGGKFEPYDQGGNSMIEIWFDLEQNEGQT
jgi:ribosomal protein S18 acetylase RimI-like enzyme